MVSFDLHRVSYLEIYNEQLFDLLSPIADFETTNSAMTIVEDDSGWVNVKGLSCHLAQTEEEALNFLFEVRLLSQKIPFICHYL